MATNKIDARWEWLESKDNWSVYDESIQKILNTEYENGNSMAKFSVNGNQFEVSLSRMTQKTVKTGYERSIRYTVKNAKNEHHSWLWQDDNKRWLYYAPANVIEIETAYDKSETSFDLTMANKITYEMDFTKMKQVNKKTNFGRSIKRIKSECKVDDDKKEEEDEVKKASIADDEEPNDRPSRNLRKRKSNASNVDDSGDESSKPKKATLKKETSSAASKSTKKKEDDEETKATTSKKSANDDDEEENTDSHVSKSQANFEKKKKPDEQNVKTVKFSGKIPVDEHFIDAYSDEYHIYTEDEVAYDCMLNQTNLQFNNNKYYLLQLLQHKKTKTYCVWFRWGRVGKPGQTSCDRCGTDLERAKTIFCRKFADKTKNEWEFRDEFEKVAGKYDLVLKDYNADNADDEVVKKVVEAEEEAEKPPKVPDSKLDKRLHSLIDLICNIQDMEDMLKELKYDTKKAPLGKLSANQIKAGYAALKKIEVFINKSEFGSGFINACNEFYTRIPHDFGMKVPTPIKTKQALKEKISLLEALADIEIAVKVLNQKSSIENPIDRAYEQLECDLKPLDATDKTYKLISDYLQKTHAPTHCTYKMKILDIFEVYKKIEHERFNDVGNRLLLWHGSRITNWAGILSQGIKIAPPEAPVTGYMFGKGCYFADCSSKSANYCYATQNKNIGLVSLSEVSLGDCNELLHDDYNADKLPANKSSTKGLGKSEPNPKEWVKLDDGLTVPIGSLIPTGKSNPKGYTLLYNEYVVYDVAQIKTKYIVKVEFDFDE